MHHLASSDRVIVLESGRVSQQGTFEAIQSSGYDLSGISTRSNTDQSKADTKAYGGKESDTTDPLVDDREDEEGRHPHDSGGWLPYKFYSLNIGYKRVIISAISVLVVSAFQLGTQVCSRYRCTPRSALYRVFCRVMSKHGRILMVNVLEPGWVGMLQ